MKSKKVSIVVPVYNVEKYLDECINSIVSQDFENKEVILVDDGSTDSSGAMCDEYAQKYDYIKVVHQANSGLSEARNTGVLNAQGEYILFVDSDDYIEPQSLGKIMSTVSDNDYDVVFLEALKLFPDGTKEPLGDGLTVDGIVGKSRDQILRFIASCPKYPAAAWSKLTKKTLFDNVDLTFKKGIYCEDIDWTFKLVLNSQTYGYCPDAYYVYRQSREGSITNTNTYKRLRDLYSIAEKWQEIAKERFDCEREFILSELAYEYPILLLMYSQLLDKEKKEYSNKLVLLKSLLKHRGGLKYKIIHFMCSIFGINITSKLINLYIKHR